MSHFLYMCCSVVCFLASWWTRAVASLNGPLYPPYRAHSICRNLHSACCYPNSDSSWWPFFLPSFHFALFTAFPMQPDVAQSDLSVFKNTLHVYPSEKGRWSCSHSDSFPCWNPTLELQGKDTTETLKDVILNSVQGFMFLKPRDDFHKLMKIVFALQSVLCKNKISKIHQSFLT